MHIKVSIIVPVYNVEKYISKCIESLLAQTLHEIEIILVDDGSLDSCPEICDRYANNDKRVKVVHKRNEGLGFARNTGLEYAKGDYVTFCDSDDWVEPKTYEVAYQKAKEKDLDICCFQSRRVSLDGIVKSTSHAKEEFFVDEEKMRWFRKEIIGRNPNDINSKERGFSSCMAIFRRDLFIDTGIRYPSERVVASEDFIFMMYFMQHVKRVGILPYVFYNYLINPCSISNSYSTVKHERLMNMLGELTKFCKANYRWNDIKNNYYSQVLRIFKVILKYTCYSEMPFLKKVSCLTRETKNPLLTALYDDSDYLKYGLRDGIYVFMMKYHIGIFFYFLYKLKR